MTPLFPLHAVAFPGLALPIVVFEPRYREMMRAVLERPEPSFVVAAISEGMEVGGYADVYDVGCRVGVERADRRADGTIELLARGRERVRLGRRLPDDPYPRTETAPYPDTEGSRAGDAFAEARAALSAYLAALERATGRTPDLPDPPADLIAASYALSALLRTEVAEHQALLELPTAADRLRAAAGIARREASLIGAIGPTAGSLGVPISPN